MSVSDLSTSWNSKRASDLRDVHLVGSIFSGKVTVHIIEDKIITNWPASLSEPHTAKVHVYACSHIP